mmetsp:Transcript_103481/g.289889  ORF Transcript_103481/g.289889 Transcript_103481/m.289889 type:complete len:200 (-) Transcript_103481:236-835(-)
MEPCSLDMSFMSPSRRRKAVKSLNASTNLDCTFRICMSKRRKLGGETSSTLSGPQMSSFNVVMRASSSAMASFTLATSAPSKSRVDEKPASTTSLNFFCDVRKSSKSWLTRSKPRSILSFQLCCASLALSSNEMRSRNTLPLAVNLLSVSRRRAVVSSSWVFNTWMYSLLAKTNWTEESICLTKSASSCICFFVSCISP